MDGKRVIPHEDKPMDVQMSYISYECQFGKERNARNKAAWKRKMEEKERLVSSPFFILFIQSPLINCFQNLTRRITR